MDSLNVFRMVVSPRSSHAAGIDKVGYDVGVVGKSYFADSAFVVLGHNLLVQQLSHLRVRADLAVSSRVEGIAYSADSHLALALFSWDCFPPAAEEGAVDRTELLPAKSHDVLLICLGAMV
jgi:hypothetical protein